MGIPSGQYGGYYECAVGVVGSSTLLTGRGMGQRSAVGFLENSSWTLSSYDSSTEIILMCLAGRQGAPVEGGVLLRFRTLHLHALVLVFLCTDQCAILTPPLDTQAPLSVSLPDDKLTGSGTAHLFPFYTDDQSLQEPFLPPTHRQIFPENYLASTSCDYTDAIRTL